MSTVNTFLEILHQWRIPLAVLFAYYIAAAAVLRFICRRWRVHRASGGRSQVIFAVVLALAFTPSLLTDFWILWIPAPAILGLLFLVPAMFVQPWPFVPLGLLYHVLPLTVAFGIAYLLVRFYDRRRPEVARTA